MNTHIEIPNENNIDRARHNQYMIKKINFLLHMNEKDTNGLKKWHTKKKIEK